MWKPYLFGKVNESDERSFANLFYIKLTNIGKYGS